MIKTKGSEGLDTAPKDTILKCLYIKQYGPRVLTSLKSIKWV